MRTLKTTPNVRIVIIDGLHHYQIPWEKTVHKISQEAVRIGMDL